MQMSQGYVDFSSLNCTIRHVVWAILPTTADQFTKVIVTLGPSLKMKRGLLFYPFKELPYDWGTTFIIEAPAKVW